MSPGNRLQFAVVREDPVVELSLLPAPLRIAGASAPEALIVASGGCTALALSAHRPDVRVTALDMNPAQLALVREKFEVVRAQPPGPARTARFGVGVDDATTLNAGGNFESLFRGFRAVLDDLVMSHADRHALLSCDPVDGDLLPLIENRYWPVAFALFFSDAMLETMFGPDATQHAERGSYPGYFRSVVERGLHRPDRRTNRYLQHVLLGTWLDDAVPAFLGMPAGPTPTLVHAAMIDAPPLSPFSLVSLSNLFDWMNDDGIAAIARRLEAELRPGAVVVIRQLNNRTPVERHLPSFSFDDARADELLARDQSLFYERLLVGVKR